MLIQLTIDIHPYIHIYMQYMLSTLLFAIEQHPSLLKLSAFPRIGINMILLCNMQNTKHKRLSLKNNMNRKTFL